jgi:hypothetical protein
MRTVRRLYFYVLALIGSQAIIWGAVNLLRTLLSGGLPGGGTNLMATGLSLLLVGLPVFLLHWLVAQRDARRDEEERLSRIRPVFLYAARVWTLIPIVYSLLALINRLVAFALGLSVNGVMFGGGQTTTDNLVSIAINLVGFAYFSWVLQGDWKAAPANPNLPECRRLYQYLWVLFGLTLTVFGVQGMLHYILTIPQGLAGTSGYLLANNMALLLVGAPLWAYTWWLIQDTQNEPGERESILRLVVLYIISLAGVVGVLASGGGVLSLLFQILLGRVEGLAAFFGEVANPLGALLPLAVMWAYYGRILEREMVSMSEEGQRLEGQRSQPLRLGTRRSGVRRLYRTLLSALGLAVTFTAIIALAEYVVDLLYYSRMLGPGWSRLSGGLAALAVGLPLWLVTWSSLQSEAGQRGEPGDRARRSVIRRAYLYLFVFLLVVGGMLGAGDLFFNVLSNALGTTINEIGLLALQRLQTLAVIAVFLIYHLRVLRADGRRTQQAIGAMHAGFPVLVIVENEMALAEEIVRDVQRLAPRLPVVVHSVERGAPDDELLSARLILLTAGLAIQPPEVLSLWLSAYRGRRLLLPLPREGWVWLGLPARQPRETAQEAAAAILQIAEGEAPRAGLPSSPWSIAGYILGGVFSLILLIALFSLFVNSLFRY